MKRICFTVIALALSYAVQAKPDRNRAVGPCQPDGSCPDGNVCVDNECYPEDTVYARYRRSSALGGNALLADAGASEVTQPSIGECVNGLCPMDYKCIRNICHKLVVSDKTPIGPCVNEKCPDDYFCSSSDYKCYP